VSFFELPKVRFPERQELLEELEQSRENMGEKGREKKMLESFF